MQRFACSLLFALVVMVFGSLSAFGQQYCQDVYGNVFPCPPPQQPAFGQPWPYALPGNSPFAQQLNNTNAFVQGVTDNALIAPLAILGSQLGAGIRAAQPQYYYPQYTQYPGYQQQYGPPPGYYPQGQPYVVQQQQPYYYQQQAPQQYPQGQYYYPQSNQYPPSGYYPQQQYGIRPQGQPYVVQPGGLQPQQPAVQPYGYYPWQQPYQPPRRIYRRTSQNEHIDLRDLADGAGNIVGAATGNPRVAAGVDGGLQIVNFIKQIHDQRQDAKREKADEQAYQQELAVAQQNADRQLQATLQLVQSQQALAQQMATAQEQAQNHPPQPPPSQYPQQYGPQQQFAPSQVQQKLHATFKNCLLKGAVLIHVKTDAGEEAEFVIISDAHFQKLCHLPNRAGVQIINEGRLNSFRNWDHVGPISEIDAILCGFDGENPIPEAMNPSGDIVFKNLVRIKDPRTGKYVQVPCTQSQQGQITVYTFCKPMDQ